MRAHHVHYLPPTKTPEPDLFDPLAAVPDFQNAPLPLPPFQRVDTSLAAAAKISGHTQRIREAIFLWIKAQGARGATAGEVEDALALSGSTVRPRLRELQGDAPWAKGKLPQRIKRTDQKRGGMRIYASL